MNPRLIRSPDRADLSEGRPVGGLGMGRFSRERWGAAAVAAGTCAAVVVALLVGAGSPARSLDFRLVGHWVYSSLAGAVFHVDGGSRQVDARTGALTAGTGAITVEDKTHGYVVSGGHTVVFGKSTLAVQGTTDAGATGEEPVAVQTADSAALVYRQSGTIVRLGIPSSTIATGGPVSSAVGTDDGTVYFERGTASGGDLCLLSRQASAPTCPARAPQGHRGGLTVVAGRAAFVDTSGASLAVLGADGLGSPVGLRAPVTPDTLVSPNAAGQRLPLLEPGERRLVLADVGWVTHGGTQVLDPVSVSLPPGRYKSPVATDHAVAVFETGSGTVLTYDVEGRQRDRVTVPGPSSGVRVTPAQDGRVYVDNAAGTDTLVVDQDGSVSTVAVAGTDVPSVAPPTTPVAPPSGGPPSPATSANHPTGPRPAHAARPGAPRGFAVRPGDGQAQASWGAAAANGSPLTAYHLTWSVVSGTGTPGSADVPGTQTSDTLTGLVNGTSYVLSVVAENGVGRGPASRSAAFTPAAGAPGAPGTVQATAGSDGAGGVDLIWGAAAGQGHQVTRYTVDAVSGAGTTTVGQSAGTSLAVTGGQLTPGTTYRFTVTAISDTGASGPPSAASNPITPYTRAGAPGNLGAQPGDGTLSVSWNVPDLGGGDLAEYVVSGNGFPTTTTATPSIQLAGLTNGTSYTVTVFARTRQHGTNGPTLDGATAQLTRRPGVVPSVALGSAALTGDRQITVAFTVNDHGSGAVQCQILGNGGTLWNGACANGSHSQVIANLQYGTAYDVSVTATNGFGASTSGHAGVSTNPAPMVTIVKGSPVTGDPNCNNTSCRWLNVTLANFAANTHYTYQCYSTAGGGFQPVPITTNGSGAASAQGSQAGGGCFFGFVGQQIWIVVNGVQSNVITW
jgi:Fibronectin type III domain